jgi:hypothetical protein
VSAKKFNLACECVKYPVNSTVLYKLLRISSKFVGRVITRIDYYTEATA